MVNVYHQKLFIQLKYFLATIKTETYTYIWKTEFKTRLDNHKTSFKNRQKEKDTELSKYMWNLKDKNITNYSIKWMLHSQTNIWS